jgi:hypothetical protein
VNSLQSVILTLALSYALIGALLLIVLVYARLHWSAKAVAVVVTSVFYIASFVGVRGLLGWATVDRLPVAFKLLQARIVEPHSLEGDPGAIYLWVETLDDGNRPSGVPRAFRLPYRNVLAEKTDKAISEIAAGHPQGGRAADYGSGNGQAAPEGPSDVSTLRPTAAPGGDPMSGGPLDLSFLTGQAGNIEFAPLPAPILPPKDGP